MKFVLYFSAFAFFAYHVLGQIVLIINCWVCNSDAVPWPCFSSCILGSYCGFTEFIKHIKILPIIFTFSGIFLAFQIKKVSFFAYDQLQDVKLEFDSFSVMFFFYIVALNSIQGMLKSSFFFFFFPEVGSDLPLYRLDLGSVPGFILLNADCVFFHEFFFPSIAKIF